MALPVACEAVSSGYASRACADGFPARELLLLLERLARRGGRLSYRRVRADQRARQEPLHEFQVRARPSDPSESC